MAASHIVPLSVAPSTLAHAIEVLTTDYLHDVGGDEVTVTVGTRIPGLTRDDGTPSQAEDVLSVQPDGRLQTRAAKTSGPFERAKVTPAGLIFRPNGQRAFLVPLATVWPNPT
jgi:hypothetical protein